VYDQSAVTQVIFLAWAVPNSRTEPRPMATGCRARGARSRAVEDAIMADTIHPDSLDLLLGRLRRIS